MSFEFYMTSTVVVEHVISTRDDWGNPQVETVVFMGRDEPSKILYRSESEGIKTALAKLFCGPLSTISVDDYVTVGGVRYKVKTTQPMRARGPSAHHIECDLESGQ